MNSGKEKERKELENSVEAFLQKGGRIQKVPSGRSGDKTFKPYSHALPPNMFKPINAAGGFKRWRSQSEVSYKLHKERSGSRKSDR